MSSRNSQIKCDAMTAKGHNCRNFAIKGEKWCFQHKKHKDSELVVHTTAAVIFEPVVFSKHKPSKHKCKFQNKFGEFVCNSKQNESFYCEEHNHIRINFFKTMKHLCDLSSMYKTQHFTLDSYIKLLKNIVNYCETHKEYFVNFSLEKVAVMLSSMIQNNFDQLSVFISTPLVIHKNSTDVNLHLISLSSMLENVNILNVETQIKKARCELVSNNIKVNKLTEIYLKQTEKSQILPVFSKGIDKKILSFIV